jgi:hypothetical protein
MSNVLQRNNEPCCKEHKERKSETRSVRSNACADSDHCGCVVWRHFNDTLRVIGTTLMTGCMLLAPL